MTTVDCGYTLAPKERGPFLVYDLTAIDIGCKDWKWQEFERAGWSRGRECFPQLGSGRTFTYSKVGAQKKTTWRKLYLLAASQLKLREKFLGI